MWNLKLLYLSTAFSATPLDVPRLPIEAYRLPNGLKVVLHRDASVPRTTVCVAYHVGSKNERAGRTGFAHFFEHMMFRGTKLTPNYDLPLQEAGASANAFTTEDVTVYHETIPSNYLERALYLEAERLAFLGTALDQSKFDTEREIVKNERRQRYENVPYGLADETILAHVFPPGHPYSWSVIGSMRDLNAAALPDLVQFFGEFYHPGNACLCVAGALEPAQTKAWIDRYFGPIPASKTPPAASPPALKAVAKRIKQTDQVQLPRIHWSWPTVADDHADAPAISLLATMLANGETSRLHRALVLDRRLATDVAASSETKEIAGLFTVQATAAEGKTLAEIEKVIGSEIEKLRAAPPSQAELDRAIARFERSTYTSLAGSQRRAFTLALSFLQKNDAEYYRADYARYFTTTPADVHRVAQKYLAPEFLALEINPVKKGEAESEAVLAGPEPTDAFPSPTRPPVAPSAGWTRLPSPTKEPTFTPPKFERRTLSNGVSVWICPWKTLPIASIRLILPMGSGDDTIAGVSMLTASLLDKGTADLTATQLAEKFENLGIALSIESGTETTRLSFTAVAKNLPPAFALIAGMLAEPRIDSKDFEREKELQLAELLQGPDRATWIAQRAFRAVLYGGAEHPYRRPIDGYTNTVASISRADVQSFYQKHALSDSTTLVVAGDVDAEALLPILESTLGRWNNKRDGGRTESPKSLTPPGDVLFLVDKPDAVQSVVTVGRPWRRRTDAGYFESLLGNRIVGGDFLSRINQNLRERNGYTYGAYSSLTYYRKELGVWSLQTSVRADATAAAIRELIAEFDALAKAKPIEDEEFQVNKDAELRTFPESFEEPGGIASAVDELAIFDLPTDYLSNYPAALGKVSKDQTQKTAAELVHPKGRCHLVVGDRKRIEPDLKKLTFRQIVILSTDGKQLEPMPANSPVGAADVVP